jgi:hypothetical protein
MRICGLKACGLVEGFERLNQEADVVVGEMLLHRLKHSSKVSHFIGLGWMSDIAAIRSRAVNQALAIDVEKCKPRQPLFLVDETPLYVLRADTAIGIELDGDEFLRNQCRNVFGRHPGA